MGSLMVCVTDRSSALSAPCVTMLEQTTFLFVAHKVGDPAMPGSGKHESSASIHWILLDSPTIANTSIYPAAHIRYKSQFHQLFETLYTFCSHPRNSTCMRYYTDTDMFNNECTGLSRKAQ